MFSSNTFLEIFHSLTNKRKEILQHGWMGSFFYDIYGSEGKESACNAGDLGSIPGLGRPPEEGHGNPLQYSGLKNTCGQRSLVGYSPWSCTE